MQSWLVFSKISLASVGVFLPLSTSRVLGLQPYSSDFLVPYLTQVIAILICILLSFSLELWLLHVLCKVIFFYSGYVGSLFFLSNDFALYFGSLLVHICNTHSSYYLLWPFPILPTSPLIFPFLPDLFLVYVFLFYSVTKFV